MKWACIDFETSVDNRGEDAVGSFSGTPFSPKNKIVAAGLLIGTTPTTAANAPTEQYYEWYYAHHNFSLGELVFEKLQKHFTTGGYIIGHNVKFDLHYLRKELREVGKEDAYLDSWKKRYLWDTQLAEYLITGQAHLYPKLNSLIEQYGGTLKDSQIEAFWKDGVRTEDIPKRQLLNYMENDVRCTADIFLKQYSAIKDSPLHYLNASQQDALLAYQSMEFNGLRMDTEKALKRAKRLEHALEEKTKALNKILQQELKTNHPNCNSAQQLSRFLFGGSWKEVEKRPLLDNNGKQKCFLSGLKKGQPRTKNTNVTKQFGGLLTPDPKTETKTKGIYTTGVQSLKALIDHPRTPESVRKFLRTFLVNRELRKELSTYYIGYLRLTWADKFIHHNLNNCATATGRLSSSAPNMQNLKGRDGDT